MTGHLVCSSRCKGWVAAGSPNYYRPPRKRHRDKIYKDLDILFQSSVFDVHYCPYCGNKLVKEYELREDKVKA
jgi:hypothetical protein